MTLDKEDIEELKKIHKKEFGVDVLDKEAEEIGSRLLLLYEILVKPLPSELKSEHKEL